MPKLDLNIYGLDETSLANSVSRKALGEQDVVNAEGADVSEKMSKGTYSKKGTGDPIDNAPPFILKHEKDLGKGGKGDFTEGNHGKQGQCPTKT